MKTLQTAIKWNQFFLFENLIKLIFYYHFILLKHIQNFCTARFRLALHNVLDSTIRLYASLCKRQHSNSDVRINRATRILNWLRLVLHLCYLLVGFLHTGLFKYHFCVLACENKFIVNVLHGVDTFEGGR